ncbi:MAG: hypothetical protein QF590_00675 [Dehalococcoidia bacterium]|jgi:hypothetical protein|nr:hypothetical protein [Dehalococcoidia bacterium]MDP7089797.1 hypothetical protein [Dehalococcoidia bacterium]MDP7262776.1 hypothetical protein [Dehalococcoidia bacterium]MDP7485811.1 hypothetical protein [Dehalococcoidia bacterium]|tara:strand:- start:2036 stop:2185 length:150 start_codon:yes stop_codon:yes gene_type:complete
MFVEAWGESIMVRAGEERTTDRIASGEAKAFNPMDTTPMREYILLGLNE